MRLRFATRAFVLGARLAGGLSRLCHYFAASTLRLADIKEGVQQSWQGFNIREADIASGLMPWERDLVQRFVTPGAAVLVVGCGSGRDVLPLIERGCHVTGIDPASLALSVAQRALRERHLSADLIEGFFEDVPLSGQFDVVIFSYYSYSYIPESARRVDVLRKAVAHLAVGGHILVSYPRMPRSRPFMIRLARIMGRLGGSDWQLESGDVVAGRTSRNKFYYSYVHAFQPEEIDKESLAAGLRIVYRSDADDPLVALALGRADG